MAPPLLIGDRHGGRRVGLAIGHGIEIALRLHYRDRAARAHAARQNEPGHGNDDRQSKRAHNPHLGHS